MRLENRVAIITGGAGAIGSATAFAMAREGASIAIVDLKEEQSEILADQIVANGGRAVAVPADVRVADDVDRAIESALARFGRLDIMFNNAGLAIVKAATDHSDDDWNLVIDTDLRGTFFGCRAAANVMLPNKAGCILNTASIIGTEGFSYRAAYSAAKAGVINLTRTLASEWALDGVRVNAIVPGYILTEGFENLDDSSVLNLDNMRRRIPMGRLGSPADVASAAVFLASDEASYITGVALPVDGGYTAYGGAEPIPSRPYVRMDRRIESLEQKSG
ncbi:MAG: hypothetical protein C7B45_09830 [Sulfobacillus acidophilus]|uniref:Short-chain dehydrogenase n=1 Tax=Sulfobacillus acidophilus TaxID=53633 RepID=A0A2T2WHI1_9FIRM|nr:MAG: hypothetical protein C7B45_09830 [Sulfobacillus acidophilus]